MKFEPRWPLAHWSARAQFFVLGTLFGSWGAHIPSVKAHYRLDEAELALALLLVAAGAVVCLTMAGAAVSRFGPRRVVLAAGLGSCLLLAAALWPTSFALVLPLLALYGGMTALFDVAMNSEGVQLEEVSGKKVMSGLHAMFSLGGMAGAAVCALLIAQGMAPTLQLGALTLAAALLLVVVNGWMLPFTPQAPSERTHYTWPRGTLALLGLLAAVALLAEGVMYDWSVLFLHTQAHASAALAALGYASFAAAMACARLCGDWLRERVASGLLLSGSAVMAAVAMMLALAVPQTWVVLPCFALVGVGLANMVPILFIAAAKVPGVAPATGIAAASSLGYLGFLVGPPLVGAIAHASSLRWAMGVVVLASLLLVFGARLLGRIGQG